MATPLEDEAIEVGTRLLGPSDWMVGKHAENPDSARS